MCIMVIITNKGEIETMGELKLQHEIFYGESEDEVAEQVNRFSLHDWVDWAAEEDYMEHDRSYATVLYYYMLGI